MDRFKTLFLLGRPAAGKSEVIDFLKKTPVPERLEKYHIGEFKEFDDFPYIWERFEDDMLLEKVGMERVWTTPDLYFKDERLWDFFLEKLNLAYSKALRDDPRFHEEKTAVVEFSRGGERGWRHAFHDVVSKDLLEGAAILYIHVTYEESVRKNRRRFNPERPDSILEHGLPDEKMERLYKLSDWEEFSAPHPEVLEIQGIPVPYVVLNNMPEVTDDPAKLGPALERELGRLWKIRSRV